MLSICIAYVNSLFLSLPQSYASMDPDLLVATVFVQPYNDPVLLRQIRLANKSHISINTDDKKMK